MKGQVAVDSHPNALLVTIEEAARRLSIGRSHIYAQMQCGNLRSIRIGRSRRILERDLEAFIDELLDGPSGRRPSEKPDVQRQPVKGIPRQSGRR